MIKAKELNKIRQEALAQELKYCQEVAWPAIAPELQERVLEAAKRGKTSIEYLATNPNIERIHDMSNWSNCLSKNLKKLGYRTCVKPALQYSIYDIPLWLTISWGKENKKR